MKGPRPREILLRAPVMLASSLWLVLLVNPDWTSYRHDANNSGAAQTAKTFSGHLTVRWRYDADSRITSSPAVSNNVVYVGTWNGDVLAIAAHDGRLRWKVHLGANNDETYGGPRGVIGSLALADGVAFAVSGNCTAAAMNAATGRLLWRTTICDNKRNDDTYASPVVAGDTVLFGVDLMADRPTDRGREIGLDAHTGKVRWSFEPAQYKGMGAGVSATPAIDAHSLIAYVGTGNPLPVSNPPPGNDDGSESIIAFDTTTGKTRWVFGPVHPHDTHDDDFFSSPNRFYVGRGKSGRWLIGEGNKDGTYYAVDATSGKEIWKTSVGSSASSSIIGTTAVGNGTVFVTVYTGASGSISALRATDGHLLWSQQTGGEYEAPLLWDGAVFTTEANGWLDAFRAGTGATLGRWKLCGRATGRGPSAAADTLYIASGTCLAAFDFR